MTRSADMRTSGILLFLAAFTVSFPAPLPAQELQWTEELYGQYDFQSFSKLEAANGRIDMESVNYPLLHAAVFYETNRQRALNKLPVFEHSPALETSAKGQSDDMAKRKFFSHDSPVKGKETLARRLALVGISNCDSGENIADTFGIEYTADKGVYAPDQNGGYFSYEYKGEPIKNHTYLGLARSVVSQWMKSPGHKRNILSARYHYLGAGAARHRNPDFYNMDYFYFTQNFASIKGPAL
jgi:uncharacterized protein YkwD